MCKHGVHVSEATLLPLRMACQIVCSEAWTTPWRAGIGMVSGRTEASVVYDEADAKVMSMAATMVDGREKGSCFSLMMIFEDEVK